jgi:BMFP domain-containing protein YqiC
MAAPRILDDLAKTATGAVGVLQSARQEVEALARARLERLLDKMELVTREEFEAVKEMAAKARAENEALAARIAALEAAAKPIATKPKKRAR